MMPMDERTKRLFEYMGEYEDTSQEMFESRKREDAIRRQADTYGKAVQSLNITEEMNPDQEAEHQKISRQADLPTQVARDAGQDVKRSLRDRDLMKMAHDTPKTLEFISQFDNAAIAHDDVGNLSELETVWNGVKTAFDYGSYIPRQVIGGYAEKFKRVAKAWVPIGEAVQRDVEKYLWNITEPFDRREPGPIQRAMEIERELPGMAKDLVKKLFSEEAAEEVEWLPRLINQTIYDIGDMGIDTEYLSEQFHRTLYDLVDKGPIEFVKGQYADIWEETKRREAAFTNWTRGLKDVLPQQARDFLSRSETGRRHLAWWDAGRKTVDNSPYYYKALQNALWGVDDPALDGYIDQLDRQTAAPPEEKHLWEHVTSATLEMAPFTFEVMENAITAGSALYGTSLALGMGEIPAFAPVAYTTGATTGAYSAAYYVEAANAFNEFRQIVDLDGNPIDRRVAAIAAMVYGHASASLELTGLYFIPGMKRLAGIADKKVFGEMLAKKETKQLLLKLAAKFGKGMGAEAGTEALQEAAQILIGEGAKLFEEETTTKVFQPVDWTGEALPRIAEAGREAALAYIGFGGLGMTIETYDTVSQIGQAKLAKQYKEAWDKLKLSMDKSLLTKRSAEKAREHLQTIGASGDTYLSPDFFELHQEDVPAAMEALGVDQAEAVEQAGNGQDIVVQTEDVLTGIQDNPELFEKITSHTKPAPGAMTFYQSEQQDIAETMKKIRLSKKEMDKLQAPVRDELSRIKKEIKPLVANPEDADNFVAILARVYSSFGYSPEETARRLQRYRFEKRRYHEYKAEGATGAEEYTQLFQGDFEPAFGLYSALEKAVEDKEFLARGKLKEMKNVLTGWTGKKFKQEELDASGLMQVLEQEDENEVWTKEDMLKVIRGNRIRIEEKVLERGEDGDYDEEQLNEDAWEQARESFWDDFANGRFDDHEAMQEAIIEETGNAWDDSRHEIWRNLTQDRQDFLDEAINEYIEEEYPDEEIDTNELEEGDWDDIEERARTAFEDEVVGNLYPRQIFGDSLYELEDAVWEDVYEGYLEDARQDLIRWNPDRYSTTEYHEYRLEGEGEDYKEILLVWDNPDIRFTRHHWQAADNVLAHVRHDTRRGPNGEKILYLDEIQSDWHQKGRKYGYEGELQEVKTTLHRMYTRQEEWTEADTKKAEALSKRLINLEKHKDDAVPVAPMKQSRVWALMAFKRMVAYAAENDFDMVAWSPGHVQQDRYNLARGVDSIGWATFESDGKYSKQIDLYVPNAEAYTSVYVDVESEKITGVTNRANFDGTDEWIGKHVSELVGDRLTDQILRDGAGLAEGEELRIGGEGMTAFYDEMLPNIVRKFYEKKKYGKPKIQVTQIDQGTSEKLDVLALPMTEKMKKKAKDEGFPLFQEGEDKGAEGAPPRGAIRLYDDKYLISLFENNDLSTLLHESAHAFMFEWKQLAESGQANEQQLKDYRILLNWLGATEGEDLTVEQQEQFARGFERYLFEGRAPTADMASVFERFKDYLRVLYKSVRALNVKMTIEVREVFDRMFTDGMRIEAAAQHFGMEMPSKEVMDALGIMPEDRNYMQRLLSQAKMAAKKLMVEDRDAYRKAKKEGWRRQAERQVNANPIWQAIETLRKGPGINKAIVERKYGDIVARSLPPGVLKEDGLPPDVLAEQITRGVNDRRKLFYSGQQMVKRLSENPPKKMAIERRADELEREHDSAYTAQDYILATEEYAAFLEIIAKYYSRDARGVKPRKAFQLYAESLMEKMKVKDAIRSDRFTSSIKKYSRIEADKARMQDFAAAADANEKVRVNYAMAGLAVKNRVFVDKLKKKLARAYKSSTIHFQYWENLMAIAERYGLGTDAMVPKKPEEKVTLSSLLAEKDDLTNAEGAFLPILVNEAWSPDYRDMTMREIRELNNLVDFLIGRGRDKKKQMLADRKQSVQEAAEEIQAELLTLKDKAVYKAGSYWRGMTDATRKFWAQFDSLQFIAIAMGGYKNIGGNAIKSRTEELIVDPLIEAQDRETVYFRYMHERLLPHMLRLNKAVARMEKEHGTNIVVAGVDTPYVMQQDNQKGWWTGEQVIALALNWGNEGNRQRILNGYEGLSSDMIEKLFDKLLTKSDWDAIQKVWDTINEMWPDINEVYQRINHIPMDKVEAAPVFTRHGKYKGGYYPAKYTSHYLGEEGRKAARWGEKEDLMNSQEAIFQVPVNKSGFTKKREETGVRMQIKLSLSVLSEHLRDTVHYITHAEAVRDADAITQHHLVADQTTIKLGKDVFEQIRPALKFIARPSAERSEYLDSWITLLRGRTTPFILGLNVSVALKQIFSLPGGIYEMGLGNFVRGIPALMTSPVTRYQQMMEISPYIAQRKTNFDREIYTKFKNMSPGDRQKFLGIRNVTWDKWRDRTFFMIQAMDMVAVIPLWNGAFLKMMRETGGDSKASVKYADDIVRRSQPSAQALDLTAWQRTGGAARLLSMFQTFTVGKYGQRQRLYFRARREGKITRTEYAYFNLMDAVLPALGMQILFALLYGKDFDEDLFLDIILGTASYWALTGMPVVGSFVSGKSLLDTPLGTLPDELRNAGGNLLDMAIGETAPELFDVFDALITLGSAFTGLPASQVIHKVRRGMEQDDRTPISDVVRYLIPAPKD